MHDSSSPPVDVASWRNIAALDALSLPAGTSLFRSGDCARVVYAITDGITKLTTCYEGERDVLVALRASGDFVGLEATILRKSHECTAETVTRCRVQPISARMLEHWVTTEPEFADQVLKRVAEYLRVYIDRSRQFGTHDMVLRLRHVLVTFARVGSTRGRDGSLHLTSELGSRTLLAQAMCVERETASRLLHQLCDIGDVRLIKDRIVLPANSPILTLDI